MIEEGRRPVQQVTIRMWRVAVRQPRPTQELLSVFDGKSIAEVVVRAPYCLCTAAWPQRSRGLQSRRAIKHDVRPDSVKVGGRLPDHRRCPGGYCARILIEALLLINGCDGATIPDITEMPLLTAIRQEPGPEHGRALPFPTLIPHAHIDDAV